MDEERTEIKRPVYPAVDLLDLMEHADFAKCSRGAQGFYLRFVSGVIGGSDIAGLAVLEGVADDVALIALATETTSSEVEQCLAELSAAGMIACEGGVWRDLFFDWSEWPAGDEA